MSNTGPFIAPWWARGAHRQTLWPPLIRWYPRPAVTRERIELADGDFIDLDWLKTDHVDGPLLLILHGLEGSSRSPYARGLLNTCQTRGWRAAVMHFRGCSGEPNRLARSYHCGETTDLDAIINHLRSRAPHGLGIVGYSLGGSVLLKWLGEQGVAAPIHAAAAVSVPFDLHCAADTLNRGFARFYQWALLRQTRRSVQRKKKTHGIGLPTSVAHLTTFRAFDNAVTAPLHGFRDANDYYTKTSCIPYLIKIRVPTLIIHAADDPFGLPTSIPHHNQLSSTIQLEVSHHGGHVGFVCGRYPWRPRYWLDDRLAEFFAAHFDAHNTHNVITPTDASQ